jgi:hypothetical protein
MPDDSHAITNERLTVSSEPHAISNAGDGVPNESDAIPSIPRGGRDGRHSVSHKRRAGSFEPGVVAFERRIIRDERAGVSSEPRTLALGCSGSGREGEDGARECRLWPLEWGALALEGDSLDLQCWCSPLAWDGATLAGWRLALECQAGNRT